jgi:hypothetical protein
MTRKWSLERGITVKRKGNLKEAVAGNAAAWKVDRHERVGRTV